MIRKRLDASFRALAKVLKLQGNTSFKQQDYTRFNEALLAESRTTTLYQGTVVYIINHDSTLYKETHLFRLLIFKLVN